MIPHLLFLSAMILGFSASAFFSGTETAFVSVSLIKVRHAAAKQKKGMALLEKILERPEEFLTTVLVGNNIANVFTASVASYYAALMVANAWEQKALLALGLTPLLLIAGEIIPKTLARHNPLLFCQMILPFYRIIAFALSPVMRLITVIQRVVLGESEEERGREAEVAREEIRHLVRSSEQKGTIEDDEAEMIDSVIELGNIQVREIMIPRVSIAMIEDDSTYNQVMTAFLEEGYSRLPVYRETPDTVIGLVHFLSLFNCDSENFKLSAILHPIHFVPESMAVDDLITEFKKKRAYQAIVVDEYGGTSGLVTVEDALEEIFGEIEDESDEARWALVKLSEGIFSVDAAIDLDELEEQLGLVFGATEAESLGGYIIEKKGMIPSKGSLLETRGFDVIVSEADNRAIRRVIIKKHAEGE